MSLKEYVNEFDKAGKYRKKVDIALGQLRRFRREYPFKTHSEQIDDLEAEDIYDKGKNSKNQRIVNIGNMKLLDINLDLKLDRLIL